MIFETSASSSLFSATTNNNHGYSSASTDEFDDAELTPTQLLSLAIRKRRELYDRKERDFRRELLHTGMVRRLCKALGDEGRAKRRRHRKSGRSRSRSASALGKRKLSEPTSSYSTETGVAGIPLPPEPPVATESEPVQSFDVPPPPPPAEPMDDAPLAVNLSDDTAAAAAVADDDEQEPQPKRSKLDSDAMDEDDPFGLDAIFAGLYATEERAVPNAFTSVIEPSRG